MGIFQEKDPKIPVIKKVLNQTIKEYLDMGLEWVIIAGNLGVEKWVSEVVLELKADYPELRLGLIFPFEGFGGQWNENNQLLLEQMTQAADYVNTTSKQPYKTPNQLRAHTQFLLEHTDGCLLIYDPEFEGKTKYFLRDANQYSEKSSYDVRLITMDDLQNSIDQ